MADLPPEVFQPKPQIFYTFNDGEWEEGTFGEPANAPRSPTRKLRVITWNLGGLFSQFAQIRMECALKYLEELVSRDINYEAPAIIMLQEMTGQGIGLIKSTAWIRAGFTITDVDSSRFHATYGVTTLVDRRLSITDSFRVRWSSRFGRDGLFLDLSLPDIVSGSTGLSTTIRICNTHLESRRPDPPMRPAQVRTASEYLHADGIHGSVLAGDMNSKEQSDVPIATDNSLVDAYLELGGLEGDETGFTSGYQSNKHVSQPYRLDKVFYCGGLVARNLERIGVGLAVDHEKADDMTPEELGVVWVTDHYGLVAEMEILNDRNRSV